MINTTNTTIATSTYRHNSKENTYLFVVSTLKWETLPEPLRQQFSDDAKVIDFDMTPNKKLARADSQKVWDALSTQGYYLQMPPSDPNELKAREDAYISQLESSKTS
jgi:uncharacterized protein YcgL (UPF0745 family)